MAWDQRIFTGLYPAGVHYADRTRAEGGDYKRLAFLSYGTLELRVEPDCPPDLEVCIRESAGRYRIGEVLEVSGSGQTVKLGTAVKLHRYGCLNRPPGIGCLPRPADLFEERPADEVLSQVARHGVVGYRQALTEDEARRFDLALILTPEEVAERVVADFGEYAAAYAKRADRNRLAFQGDVCDRMRRLNLVCAGGAEAATLRVLKKIQAERVDTDNGREVESQHAL